MLPQPLFNNADNKSLSNYKKTQQKVASYSVHTEEFVLVYIVWYLEVAGNPLGLLQAEQ